VADCRPFDLLCAMLRRVATHKTRSGGGGGVAPSVFRHLGEELKRPGASTRGAAEAGAAASNKRTLGEIRAARRLSRMFSPKRRLGLNSLCLCGAACSMRVTSAGQFRVIGKMRRVTFLEAVHLRCQAA
jgi:hypothetical protein